MIILLSRLNAIKDQTAEEMGSKRKLNDLGLTPSSKRRHTNFGGPMENLSMKYPHLSESIFNKIDNLTLNICRRMSTIWCGFIDEQRSTWIRTLQKHVKNFEESPETWKKVVQNTPFEIIKQLALTGKSLIEALILLSTNPQYDFIDLPVQ